MTAVPTHTPPPIRFEGVDYRARKQFLGGTHRCASPDATLERIQPYFATAGITRIADISGLDGIGLTTIVAQRPNAPTLANASGKGFSRVAATVSAAMEGLEIYHAETVRAPVRFTSYEQLAGDGQVLAPTELSYTDRALFRASNPEPWVRGWDLMRQEPVFVPYDAVSLVRYPKRRPAIGQPFQFGSNGLASGNEFLEAVAAGLYEVIERDALACQTAAHKHGRDTVRLIDQRTITDPFARDLLDRLAAHAVTALVWEYTVDTHVPVYKAFIFDTHDRHRGVYGGYGAHLDHGIAITRALTEAAQSRAIIIAGSRDDFFRHDELRTRLQDNSTDLTALEHTSPLTAYSTAPSAAAPTFEEDVATLLARLQAAGLTRAIVVDLTREGIDVPVIRAIVPGLEGYLSKVYAPGPRADAARRGGIPIVRAPRLPS